MTDSDPGSFGHSGPEQPSRGKGSSVTQQHKSDRRGAGATPDNAVGAGGVIDRRSGLDRREAAARLGQGETSGTGLERRRGPGRRRTDFTKSAEEGEMNKEQFLFLLAIDAFKKANHKTFPSWTDVLEVMRLLGYRKTCRSELSLVNAEDWLEKPDAPHGVRSVTHEE